MTKKKEIHGKVKKVSKNDSSAVKIKDTKPPVIKSFSIVTVDDIVSIHKDGRLVFEGSWEDADVFLSKNPGTLRIEKDAPVVPVKKKKITKKQREEYIRANNEKISKITDIFRNKFNDILKSNDTQINALLLFVDGLIKEHVSKEFNQIAMEEIDASFVDVLCNNDERLCRKFQI